MPYIKVEDRKTIDPKIQDIINYLRDLKNSKPEQLSGQLNYIFTKILVCTEPKNYDEYNSCIGMLECCKQEFYRRAIVPYETGKQSLNGEVFNDSLIIREENVDKKLLQQKGQEFIESIRHC